MNKNLLNVMGSFSETALDCIEKQNQEIESLQQELTKYKERNEKAIKFIEEHNKNAGNLYYRYNNRYLLSEIKEDLLEILEDKEKE